MRHTHLSIEERQVHISLGRLTLEGNLNLPKDPHGIILFAHGSGSSRHSPRNQQVARILNDGRLATLLLDLLSVEEEKFDLHTAELRFDIDLLGERVAGAAAWLRLYPDTQHLRVGVFGASTGAAAALEAAGKHPEMVDAIVSRGGRPDLADAWLGRVRAPTLLIVGGKDYQVLALNQEAYRKLTGEKQLVIVPGATHLFPEHGKLNQVARLASDWFERHLSPVGAHLHDEGLTIA